jgi:hypothetical protein
MSSTSSIRCVGSSCWVHGCRPQRLVQYLEHDKDNLQLCKYLA